MQSLVAVVPFSRGVSVTLYFSRGCHVAVSFYDYDYTQVCLTAVQGPRRKQTASSPHNAGFSAHVHLRFPGSQLFHLRASAG